LGASDWGLARLGRPFSPPRPDGGNTHHGWGRWVGERREKEALRETTDGGERRRARSKKNSVSEREGATTLSPVSLSSLFFCARRPTNTPHPSTKTPPLSLTPCAPRSSRPRGEEDCRGSAARSFPISRARTPDRTNKQKSDAPASLTLSPRPRPLTRPSPPPPLHPLYPALPAWPCPRPRPPPGAPPGRPSWSAPRPWRPRPSKSGRAARRSRWRRPT